MPTLNFFKQLLSIDVVLQVHDDLYIATECFCGKRWMINWFSTKFANN